MKTRGFFLTLLIAAWLGPPAWAGAATSEIRAVRLQATPAQTLLRFDLDAAVSGVATSGAGTRLIVEFKRARLGAGVRLPRGGVVRSISADRRAGGVRFVILLQHPLPVASSWKPGAHFVLQLQGAPAQTQVQARIRGKAASRKPAATVDDPVDDSPTPVRVAHAPADSGRAVVIAVDAGHGGEDPGAIGHDGTHEKDVTLAVARQLAARIEAEPGMHAVLTRDSDVFLPLRDRIRRARAAKADLFVSVHADSIANSAVSGSSVYVLSERGATNEAARWLAARENAADLMGGVSLSDKNDTLASVLLDLSQSASISASMTAAQSVLQSLVNVGAVRKPQVQQAGFVVLKSPDIPSMLVETAYISNPADERRLRSPASQQELARAIFSGLRGYFRRNPPPGTRFAQLRAHADTLAGGPSP